MSVVKEISDVDVLLNSLGTQGIDCFFGSDDLKYFNSKDLNVRYYHMKHEQAAVHAADGFARVTGKPGVVLLTSASGITNGITGIATAYSDSVPLVVVASQIQDNPLKNEAFNEINISGLTMAITKHTIIINNMNCLEKVLDKAMSIAMDGRPGPVIIEISENATTTMEIPSQRFRPTKVNMTSLEKSINVAKDLI
jgi:acetolactate synthase I/II/III large subunit